MAHKRNRFLAALIAAVVMVCLLTTTVFAAEASDIVFDDKPVCYIHGDTNNDGKTSKDDAIYILYSYLLGEEYPIAHTASADLNGDTKVNTKDAIYMLYATLLADEEHPLNGSVHEYYTPFWSWGHVPADPENPESEMVLKAFLNIQCSCGQVIRQIDGTVTKASEVAPTCLTSGSISYHAEATYTYTTTVAGVESTVEVKYSTVAKEGYVQLGEAYVEELEALDHAIGEPTCEGEAVCANGCGYSLPALGHKWELTETTPATCQAAAVEHYVCGNCGSEKDETVGQPIDHTFEYKEDIAVEGVACQWVKMFACTTEGCGETKEGEKYYVHSYTAALTAEPNCTHAGTKTYTCSNKDCNHSYEESVKANGVHIWSENGTPEGNVITYGCTVDGCSETKTVVVPDTDGTVTKSDLQANELQVDKAAISLGSSALPEVAGEAKIKVAIEEKKAGDLEKLAGDLQTQIGSNTVYDFSMTVDGTPTSEFGGSITISLPYTLQTGDDVDAIDVWFIKDDGSVSVVQGKYSNGFVTFSTNHFSYYTVTRLTPAQRCVAYGHANTDTHQDPTCTEDGYNMTLCQRCGKVSKREAIHMLGHRYGDPVYTSAVTCTEDGIYTKTCTNGTCGHTVSGTTPALGHSMVEVTTEDTKAASCTEAGVTVYACEHGCSHSVKQHIPALGHKWNEDTAEIHYVSCTEAGYTEYTCDRCQAKLQADKQDPLGHAYVAEGWTWSDGFKSATLKIVCKNDHAHDQLVKGVIKTETSAASCTATGTATHTATLVFNGKTYTSDPQIETLSKRAHKPTDKWTTSDLKHHRVCADCGEKIDIADHSWGTPAVTGQPTCVKPGTKKQICAVCNHGKEESIPATGLHNLANGVCADCGFTENTCKHDNQHQVQVDTDLYGICQGMNLFHTYCDCGHVDYYAYRMDGCNWGNETSSIKTLPNGQVADVHSRTCADCGLTEEWTMGNLLVDEAACTAIYYDYNRMSMGSTLIAEWYNLQEENPMLHPAKSTAVSEKLTDKGICGNLITSTCYCGQNQETYLDGCEMEYVPADQETYRCVKCGVEMVLTGENHAQDPNDPCIGHNTRSFQLSLNGTVVANYSATTSYLQHDYAVEDYTMVGKSCADGMTLHYACRNCDYNYYIYTTFHIGVIENVTDLTSYGSCDTAHVISSCACGESTQNYFTGPSRHNWIPSSSDPNVLNCDTCGFTRTTTRVDGQKGDNCIIPVAVTYTFSDGNGHSYTQESVSEREQHNYKPQYTLSGKSCTDGVVISMVCQDCGKVGVTETHTEHVIASTKSYSLTEIGGCGGSVDVASCACGEYTSHSFSYDLACSFQWVDSENGGYNQCTNCGLCLWDGISKLSDIDACHYRGLHSMSFRKADGTELLNIAYTTVNEEHRQTFSFALKDKALGCEGGYDATGTCLDCGHTTTMTDCYGHALNPIAWDYKPNQLCGDLNLVTYSCACGQQSFTQEEWDGDSCVWMDTPSYKYKDMPDGGWSDTWVYTCAQCGATKTESQVYSPRNDGTCNTDITQSLTFKTKSGKAAGSYVNSYVGRIHGNMLATFNLLDASQGCDGGYTVTYICSDCGESRTETETNYSCRTQLVRSDVILEGDGICGDFRMEYYSCACGKQTEVQINSNCQWDNHQWDDNLQCGIVACSDCGLVEYNWDQDLKHAGSCTATRTFGRKYVLKGQELAFSENYVTTHTVTKHNEIYSFNLNDNALGCDGGYQVYYTCQSCGFVSDPWENSGHMTFDIAAYDLTAYGMCGGRIGTSSCACGQEAFSFWDMNGGCDMHWVNGQNGEEGYDYCATCNTRVYSSESGTVDHTTCTFNGTRTWRFVRNGVELLNHNATIREERHELRAGSTELLNPNGTCEDGVEIIWNCLYCDYQNTDTVNHHEHLVDFELDLSSGCGGEIRIGGCPCGKEGFFHEGYVDYCANMTRVSNNSTDANGIQHNYTTRSCAACGLEIVTDDYDTKDTEHCKLIHNTDITITYQGQTYQHQRSWYESTHDLEYRTGTLAEGATSCEQGVDVSWVCNKCGATGTYVGYTGHALLKQEDTINLANYTICEDTALNHYKCACGAKEVYDFAPASKCDLDFQPIDHWITGVLESQEQHTTEGYIYTDSASYLIRCAVNNDMTSGNSQSCPLTIRMSEYWLNENCMAVEYQTWQIGYNEAAGTYDQEITVKTGESHAYHNYEWIDYGTVTTNTDGSYVVKHGNVCTDCGSVDMNYNTHDANNLQIQHIWERTNVNYQTNGELKRVYSVSDYGFYANNYAYETSTSWDYEAADGSTWSELYTYSNYDFSAQPCMRDQVYTDRFGNTYSERTTACHWPCERNVVLKAATCSQPGEQVHRHVCVVCGYKETWEVTPIEPMHTWNKDDTTGIYTCSVCYLESNHGASGNIVMEDLTASADSFYKIGYYVKDSLNFYPSVGVLIGTSTEPVIFSNDDYDFQFGYLTIANDGICALTFDKATAQAAAEAAMDAISYGGDYSIRITFVPIDFADELDYSITFDPQTYAKEGA